MDLFNVQSRLPEFMHHREVTIYWFVGERTEPLVLPYASQIEDYNQLSERDRLYTRAAVNELFTAAEAEALAEYLGEVGIEAIIQKADLPIASNTVPIGVIGVRWPTGFLMLSKQDTYDLPFAVCGYYDLRDASPLLADADCDRALPWWGDDDPIRF